MNKWDEKDVYKLVCNKFYVDITNVIQNTNKILYRMRGVQVSNIQSLSCKKCTCYKNVSKQ